MLWFMMHPNNKPLYMENQNYGEVYQVLDVIRKSSEINAEEESEVEEE